MEYGLTDDYSYNILENPVHVNDLNATVLKALGIDHERFTLPLPWARPASHRGGSSKRIKDLLA